MEIRKPIVNGKFTSLDDIKHRRSIFLAGPIDFNNDWRFEAFKILEDLGFDGVVMRVS